MNKKIYVAVLYFFLVLSMLFAQETPTNPSGLQDIGRGKVIKLSRAATAHDSMGRPFIFKNPHSIVSIEGKEFFLIDDGQVLLFGDDGRFFKTVVRKGQGPGEATFVKQIYKRGQELIVNTGFMDKLMVFDLKGELKSEFSRTPKKYAGTKFGIRESTFTIMGHNGSGNYIAAAPYLESPSSRGKSDNIRKEHVLLLSSQNEWLKKLFEIPIPGIVVKHKYGSHILPILTVIHTCDDEFIYFCNSERYEIKKYHIKTNKIASILRREYKPIPMPEELKGRLNYGATFKTGSQNGEIKVYQPPQPKFLKDISKLFLVDSTLWVMTSNFDRDKGILIDVYNREDQYVGNFYLPLESCDLLDILTPYPSKMHISNGYLFVREPDKEDNYIITKYRILIP